MQNPSVKKKRIKIDSSFLKIGQAAQALGVSIDTLRRWEKAGKISTVRTPGGTRLYHISALKEINPAAEPYPIETYQTDSLSTEELLKRVEKDTILGYNDTTETEESISNIPISQYPNIPSRKSSLISKFLIGSAFVSTITLLLTSWITASYLTQPKSAQQFFKNNIASPLFSPFHALAEEVITVIDPRKAKELGFAPPEDPPPVATNYKLRTLDSSVLAVTASSQFLEINSDTQINGALFVRDSVNGLSLEATPSANSFVLGSGDTTLTVTNDALLDQDVSTSASPTFNTLNLSATSNQLVFQSSGSAGGTLTWTPTAARVITLPDATGTVLLDSATQTITNKTINASNNTITNISNSALANSKVTVTAGTNLTGGGDITLGSSATISLKDSISLSGTLTAGGVVKLADGTAAAPGLTFTNDTDTGLYRIGANSIGLITGGSATSGITIDASGNVGIGTISPSYTLDVTGRVNGSTALCIAGDCKTAWSGSAGYTASNGLTLSGVDLQLGGSLTRATGIDISSQNFGFLGGNVGIGTTSAGGSLVVASGNVGIGFTSPDRITQIASDINITPSLASLLGANGTQFAITGSTAANLQKKLTFGLDTSDNYGVIQVGNTSGTAYGLVLNPAGGNVGIGTTNLNARIAGTSAPILRVVKSDGVGGGTIEVQNTTSGGGDSAIDFIDSNGNIRGNIAYYAERSASDPARFVINQGTWLAEITPLNTILNENGGNVGIGTTGPLSLLSVAGNAHIGNLYQSISAPTNGLFVDGNVGIGATTSSNKLDVWGNSRLAGTLTVDSTSTFGGSLTLSSGQFLAPNGTASLPSYSFTNSTSAGMYSPSANALALNTNGASTPPLTITAGGNVGIGITNPGSALTVIGNVGIGTSAAGAALQVNGGGLFGWGTASVAAPANGLAINGNVGIGTTSPAANLEVIPSSNSYLRLFSTTDAPAFQMLGNGDGANYAWFELGRKDSNQDRWQMSMAADGSNRLRFIALPTNSENLSLLPGGNVGIGATLPNAKLSIQGNVGIGYTGVNQAIPVNGLAVFGNVGIGTTTANSNLSISGNAHIGSLYQGISAPTDGLFVDGNVGIGATTSNNKLDVWGNARIAGTLTVDSTITPTGQFLAIDGSKSAPSYSFASSGNSDNGMYLPSANALSFSTAGNDVLTLTAGGNVGIGTTSPSQKLEINGNALLNATRPELQLLTSGTGKGRVAQYAEGAAYLTANLYYDGTNWNRDNTTIAGSVVDISDVIPFRLRYVASGANPATLTESIRINTSGNIGIGLTTANSQLSISNNVHIGSLYQGTVAPTNGLFVDGNVGIGATSTAYNLDVWGTGRFSSGLTVGGNVGIGQSLTVTSGAVLSGGLVVDGGSVVLPAGSIGNSELENSSITVSATAGTGISVSGSPVSLGGTLTVAGIDASTTVKGVASFNSTNFSVSSGAVNTIQDIATTSSPTFVGLSLTSGNLGIGTSATGAKLQVNGNGIFWPSTTSLTGPTNGLAVFGNVGIGTTTTSSSLQIAGNAVIGFAPSVAAPTNGLLVNGNVGIGFTSPDRLLQMASDINITGSLASLLGAAGTQFGITGNSGSGGTEKKLALGIDTTDNYGVIQSGNTSGTAYDLSLNPAGGNVGIGTTSPAAPLHILGVEAQLRLQGNGAGQDAAIDFYPFTPAGGAGYRGQILVTHGTDADAGKLNLQLANTSGTLTTRLYIEDGGNVGIGTDTSPDYLLELYDATNTPAFGLSDDDVAHGVTTIANTDTFLHLSSISTTVGGAQITGLADATGVALGLKGIQSSDPTDSTPAIQLIGAKASGTGVQDLGATETILQVANNDDTAALTILGNGNVGIGATIPNATLSIQGNVGIGYTGANQVIPSNGLAVFGNVGIGITTANSNLSISGNAHIGSLYQGISAPTNGLFVDGNVGIGATTSSNKLDVWGNARIAGNLTVDGTLTQNGNISTSGVFLAANGSASAPSYSFTNLTNAGLWTNGDGLLLTTGGSNTSGITVTGGGNIGIGTTAPGTILEVNRGGTGNTNVGRFLAPSIAAGSYAYIAVGAVDSTANGLSIGFTENSTDANTYGWMSVGGDDPTAGKGLIVRSGGNIGIGTTGPGSSLAVSGNGVFGFGGASSIAGPANGLAVFGNVGIGTTSPNSKLSVIGGGVFTNTWGGAIAPSAGLIVEGNTGIGVSAPVQQFQVNPNGSSAFTVTSSGFVGIGKTSPGVRLDILNGTLRLAQDDGDAVNSARLIIDGRGATGVNASIKMYADTATLTPGVLFHNNAGTAIGRIGLDRGTSTVYAGASQDDLVVGTDVSTNKVLLGTNSIVRLTVDTAGNIGIGITTANSTLSVAGSAHIGTIRQGIAAPTNGLFVDGNVGIGATTSSNKLDVWGNAAIVGNLTLTGNLLPATDDTYDLGSDTARWNNLYLGPATLHLGTSTSDEYTLAYDTTNNRLGFNVNGSGPAEIVMDSNGNIGIGTTGPVAKLEISQTSGNSLKIGKADLTDGIIVADESIHFVIDNDNTQADRLFAFDTNGNGVTELMRIQENGNVGIGTASPVGLFQVGSSPTPPLYVASGTGNVGIGTTGPVAKLEVDQTTGDVALFFSTQAANDNAIRFRTNQGDSSIGLVLDNSNTNKAAGMRMQPTTGSLTFNTGLASGGGLTTATEKMQLDTNGNLGIGTQSPIAQLDVRDTGTGTTLHTYIGSGAGQFGILDNGNVGIGTTTPGEALHVVDNNGKGIKIERTSATASSWSWRIQTGGQLQLVQDSGGANDILIQPTAAKSLIINEDSADADLRIESDNSVSAFFLEGSSGNVGIGFTSPPALFSVGSTAQFQVNSSGFALLPAGLASTPSLSFVGDTDTGLWWLGTNFLALTTNGAGALQAGSTINGLSINANGNVGIGTTNPTAALDVAGATSTISNTTGNLTITPASNLLISAGNVGIGFTSPDRKLQIGSDIDITGTAASILGANGAQFSITGSSANTTHKKLTLGIDTTDNYGVIQAGNTNGTAYDLALQPGGGNVGIGTTNPSRLLHIVDASADNNFMMNTYRTSASADIFTTQKARGTLAAPTIVASGDDVIAMTFQGYDGAAFRNVAAIRASIDAAPGSSDMPGRLTFHTTTDGSTTLTERMRIDNTGSVGIGSTSPQAARQLTLNDNGGGQLDLLAFSIAEAEKALIGYDVGGGSLITSTANHLKFTSAGGMIFATGAAVGPTSTSGMYIASAGSVGIGSTSPQADLTILGGTELIDAFDSNNRGLGIYSANLVGRLYVQGEAQADLILVDKGAGVNDKTSQLYNDGGVTTFRSLNDAGGVLNDNILVIDHSTGSVGIGAAPTTGAKLDINGALYIADTSPPGNTTVCYDGAGGSAIGGCSSLRELKTNIQDLNIGLNELMQLRPVSFDWKTGLSNDLGFIAEEVEQIAPILSTYKEDGSLQGIKYNTITALITKAIQEQQAQINNLIAQQDTNSTLLAGLSVNSDGTLNAPEVKTGKLVISSDINLTAPALASLLQTDRSQALLTTNYQLPTTNEVDLLTSLNSISEAVLGFQTQESTTSAKLDDLATKVDSQETRMQSLEEKLASLSAQIATSSAQQSASSSASEATASSLTTNYELPTTNSLDLTPPDILLATQSAQLVNLEVTSDATVSGQLTAYDLDVQNALKSLGTTTLGSTLVAGDLTVDGTMSVTGNSINVIGTLFLQNSPLAEGVDFFNGAVTIDKTGTLAVNKIALPPEVLGEATIPAGSLEIPVFSNAVTEKSKVFLTPITATGGQALIMSEIISGSGFVVSLEKPFSSDIKFNWVILDNR